MNKGDIQETPLIEQNCLTHSCIVVHITTCAPLVVQIKSENLPHAKEMLVSASKKM